ncbi:MAG: hypothetical protein F4Z82_08335 [Caldilineaceae bacterium SB0668_bin_21]|nr:hypothetical protein [Caldilineaceae bacterium SB0668_bin_21]MYC22422.1 hypothetical protein [Caldilineaceae bacterium SB0662_bin_25]
MASDSSRIFARMERQLFFDDEDIARIEGLERTLHQPNKKGAVIRSDPNMVVVGADGAPVYRPQTRTAPVWDAKAELWKFWTIGAKLDWNQGRSSYHESRDGLHWYQPSIGQLEYQGSFDNNHVAIPLDETRTSEVLGVIYDASDPDPNRRFKAISFIMEPDLSIIFGVSADGIVWKKHDAPAILSGDEPNFSFDAADHRYIATVKVRGKWGRSHAVTTSQDFDEWSEPKLVFQADDEDQELAREVIARRLANPALQQTVVNHPEEHGVDVYNFSISRYESRYIGFASMFHHVGRSVDGRNHDGFHHVQLASSQDMYTWERQGERQPFIDSSPLGGGAYDTLQMLGPSSPVHRDDELWFYYTGVKFRRPPAKWDPDYAAICLAVLRRDGFVSLGVGEEGGSLVTEPFTWEGEQLYVNAVADEGAVTVELLDVDSRPVPGYGAEDATSLNEDSVRQAVVWGENSRMPDPANGPVRLRISVTNAEIYSYWFE